MAGLVVALIASVTVLGADRELELASGAATGAPATASDMNFGGASSDGTIIVFETAASLVAEDTNGQTDVYKRTIGGGTELISADNANPDQAVGGSFAGMTPDAAHIYFYSAA